MPVPSVNPPVPRLSRGRHNQALRKVIGSTVLHSDQHAGSMVHGARLSCATRGLPPKQAPDAYSAHSMAQLGHATRMPPSRANGSRAHASHQAPQCHSKRRLGARGSKGKRGYRPAQYLAQTTKWGHKPTHASPGPSEQTKNRAVRRGRRRQEWRRHERRRPRGCGGQRLGPGAPRRARVPAARVGSVKSRATASRPTGSTSPNRTGATKRCKR
mmetsp:Transcript_101825/g.311412  ORF Transcript_101825/g.311412 Transcript_101825/m.311412 type:complete len:214 (+) Transcript_101825:63-704(+)